MQLLTQAIICKIQQDKRKNTNILVYNIKFIYNSYKRKDYCSELLY